MDATDMRYLELLSRLFPSADKASAEIINLSAILNLPKGTEFFASDIHGEYEAFSHTLRNGSGSIRLKIDDVFGDSLSENEKRSLATLIYYPREKMELVLSQVDDAEAWYAVTLQRLVAVCKRAAQKYTRSRVRKALPKDFAYIIEELMTENRHGVDKQAYYAAIVDAVIRTDRGGALVEALCLLIQRLAIERLHIVGDIYDRGPYPHIIMDALMEHHSLDIQWGNHDIVWMGASLGQRGCIAHVVRNCARYGNLSILEDAYGINVLPLASFALEAYKDDPCVAFGLKGNPDLPPQELEMNVKIQKAMAIIQFKVEAQLIDENPGFGLEGRKLLDKIDYERGTVMLDGIEYELTDTVFPTVDPADPYRLTPEEEDVMQRLEQAFTGCEAAAPYALFLDAGSLYKICNGNLLFHACVPLNADGSLMETEVFGEMYRGRALYDVMERYVRAAFDDANPELAKRGRDLLCICGWARIAPVRQEQDGHVRAVPDRREGGAQGGQNSFYSYLDDERVMGGIFEDFGMDPETSRIVCGHVPVKVKDGEDPVKFGGRVLTIDGGFSKAYQPTTGIAGYTLISNSYGFVLAAHEPLESMRAAVVNELDIHSSRKVVELVDKRTLVADTDNGSVLKQQIADLEELLEAYRCGILAEKE